MRAAGLFRDSGFRLHGEAIYRLVPEDASTEDILSLLLPPLYADGDDADGWELLVFDGSAASLKLLEFVKRVTDFTEGGDTACDAVHGALLEALRLHALERVALTVETDQQYAPKEERDAY